MKRTVLPLERGLRQATARRLFRHRQIDGLSTVGPARLANVSPYSGAHTAEWLAFLSNQIK